MSTPLRSPRKEPNITLGTSRNEAPTVLISQASPTSSLSLTGVKNQSPNLTPRSPLSRANSTGLEEPFIIDENTQVAIQRLSDLLKHPDDLNIKIDFLKKKLLQEMGTVETQLRTDVQSQYDDIQETFRIFNLSRSSLQDVRGRLSRIEVLCQENQSKIPGYDTIKELSKAHGNMAETHKYVRRFQAFQQQIDLIERLLEKAKSSEELPNNILLLLHYELFHVEEFRDITVHQAKKCSQDVVITLNRIFKRVDAVSASFTELLWEVTRDVFRWVEQSKIHYIIHIVKIVEREEQADRRAQQAEQARNAHLKMTDKASGSKWKLAEGSPRQTKSYKSKFLSVLREAIGKRVEQSIEADKSLYSVLDALEAVPSDLKLLDDMLIKAFPPEFHILDFLLAEYHGHVHRQLEALVADTKKLEGGEILRALRFVQDYHEELFRVLGVSEEVLEPALLGGNQARMVETYIGIAASKLMEWTENLLKLDLAVFLTRDREPQTNPEGKYYLSASGTAFQAYDQQIDIAADANSARVLVEIVKCCLRAAQAYQQRFAETLESELQSYLEDPSSISQGLAEYTIALMNDQLRSVDMGEPLTAKISGMLLDVYRERATTHINEMSDGFFKLASQGHDVLLHIIFNDLKPVFLQLYTAVWYEEDLMLCIVATFQDYCEGASHQLHSYLFDLLMDKLFERFVMESIKSLKNPKAQFRLPECADKSERDMAAIQDFFANYFEPKVVLAQLDPLNRLLNLASSSSKMIFLDFYPLRKQYPDMPIDLVEAIIDRRTDLDRTERREVIESIRSKESDTDFSDLSNPTIFSKISFTSPGFMEHGTFLGF